MCQSIAITLKRKNNNPLQVKIEGKITSKFLHGSLSTRKNKFLGSQAQNTLSNTLKPERTNIYITNLDF